MIVIDNGKKESDSYMSCASLSKLELCTRSGLSGNM